MKKTFAAALAAIVFAASLTGCNNSTEGNNSDSSTVSDNSSANGLTLTAVEMAHRAVGADPNNWSFALQPVEDAEAFELLLPDLTVDMFEDFCFYSDAIGIAGHEIFIGKPKAGQEDAVNSAFEKTLNHLKEQVSFYPAGQESVAGAVNGTTSHGYVYFIIHPDGAAAAAAMIDPNAVAVDPANRELSNDDDDNEPQGGDGENGLVFPGNGAGDMVKRAIEFAPENWADDTAVTTAEELPKIMKNDELTADVFEEYCLANTMSGCTVFAGKPKAGQKDAVKTAVDAAFEAIKSEAAVMPDGAANSENAVIGMTDDGYIFFVIHANGADIASAMTAPIF